MVEINGEQLNANTRIYCWNDCDNGGDMGTINLPELTEGVEVVSVSPKSEVKVSVNGSDLKLQSDILNSKIVILQKKQ